MVVGEGGGGGEGAEVGVGAASGYKEIEVKADKNG